MTLTLRPYQQEAIDAIYTYFGKWDGNPLIVLPTGTGKSVVIAEFMRGAITAYPDTRIVMLTHVKELIAQNFSTLIRNWPTAPAGIHSAGLGKRDVHSQIICAGIQSIFKNAYKVQRCDLLIVDEAHLIPRNADTMYGRFIRELKEINPHLKLIGFTATPYRLDSGMLHQGEDAMFSKIAYEMSILEAIEQGYLSEVIPKRMNTELDVSGVGTRGGEFIAGQLEKAVDVDETTQAAVDEIISYGEGRGSWLVFAAGVDHAMHIRDAVRARGYSAETVTGETPAGERDRIIQDFKRGKIRCLTNMSVLTTGFDAPGVDLIGMLRPTKSAGLFVQMIGRGTRLAEGKDNCLLLDFAGNCRRHGPVDRIKVSAPTKGDGDAPIKTCPECFTICFAGVRTCPECDYEFPEPEPELKRTAATDAVLSTQIETEWCAVTDVVYYRHEKAGKPASMRVEYRCGWTVHREWICFEHSGYARQKACAWWAKRSTDPVPMTVSEALTLSHTLFRPARIGIRPSGQYTEIVGYTDFRQPTAEEREQDWSDDDIPF
ncbi:MAG: DEAD/DEAH box helicase family protein [Rhodospirillaceae bacterium]